MLIRLEELQKHMEFRLISYSAEASELGLRPGQEWPREVRVPGLGNGQPFYARRQIVMGENEFGGLVYRQAMGCLELTIFND